MLPTSLNPENIFNETSPNLNATKRYSKNGQWKCSLARRETRFSLFILSGSISQRDNDEVKSSRVESERALIQHPQTSHETHSHFTRKPQLAYDFDVTWDRELFLNFT